MMLFYYDKDDKILRDFIKINLSEGNFVLTQIQIDKNNFVSIYNR